MNHLFLTLEAFDSANIGEISAQKYKVGDSVVMGTYEQDADSTNGTEPIEWIVVAKEQDRVLVVSKYILDQKEYGINDNRWSNSTLRVWLNYEFYQNAFTDEEKNKILLTQTSAEDNANDYVFCISREEMMEYGLGVAETTVYAREQGVYGLYEAMVEGKEGYYWLRMEDDFNSDTHPTETFIETYTKEIERTEIIWADVSRTDVGVRPAMWIGVE